MATISFTKEFAVNKKNAKKFAKALGDSPTLNFSLNKSSVDIKKQNIKEFFDRKKV